MIVKTGTLNTSGYYHIQIGPLEFRLHTRRTAILCLLALTVFGLGFFALGLGSQDIAPADMLSALFGDMNLSPSNRPCRWYCARCLARLADWPLPRQRL